LENIPEKYRTDLSIIKETIAQIIRDMQVPGFEVVLSGNEQTAFLEVKNQLLIVVDKLFNADKKFFQSLLYRVDINEKDYRKLISTSEVETITDKLTELIIRREFQKVLTRKYFADKK
jgi:hypothetical protein